MLLGSAMLGMAAGEMGGLETVVRRLQRISKVNLTYNIKYDSTKYLFHDSFTFLSVFMKDETKHIIFFSYDSH